MSRPAWLARISVTAFALILSAPAASGQAMRLGDITAGGDGLGTAPPSNSGVDERNGSFTTGYVEGPITLDDPVDDRINPSPVTGSPYIDSVFFIEPGFPGSASVSQVITRSGVRFDAFRASDGARSSWNYILRDRNGGVSAPGVRVGGLDVPGGSAVGLHASAGITYDLDALRERHGQDRIGCFTAFWGMDDCASGDVNLYAILSSDSGVLATGWRTFRATAGAGEWVQMEIPATARYLTLATGSNNGGACAHGTFAEAKITCSPCPAPGFVDLVSVTPRQISSNGGDVTFAGRGLSPAYLYFLGGQAVQGLVFGDATRTTLKGRAPPLPPGRHDAEVRLAAGTLVACLKDAVRVVASGSGEAGACGGVFPAVADATIAESRPSAAPGEGALHVARLATGEEHALLRFDLTSATPTASTIWSASLELTLLESSGPANATLLVGEVTEPWSEASVSWSSRPSVIPGLGSLTTGTQQGKLRVDVTALVTSWLTRGTSAASLSVMPGSAMSLVFHERLLPGGGLDPEGPRLVIHCTPVIQPQPPDPDMPDALQQEGVDQLRAASRRAVDLRLERGVVRFASFDLPVPPEASRDDLAKARWFLEEHRGLLRTSSALDAWQLVRRSPEHRLFFFRQLHGGVPVFPAEVLVSVGDGRVRCVGGKCVPGITLPASPRLTAREAEKLAMSYFLQRHLPGPGSSAASLHLIGDTQLRYINMGLLGDADATTRLSWQANVESGSMQAGMFIDASTGGLIYEQARSRSAFDLEIRDRFNNIPNCNAGGTTLLYTESGPATQNVPVQAIQAFANVSAAYNYYKSHFGRDSYDNKGMQVQMYLNVGAEQGQEFGAFFHTGCETIEFRSGFATRDIVAHEFAHGVMNHMNGLEYHHQAGALSESFADVFGQFVDNDDWTIGEDAPGGAIHDLVDPSRLKLPDHMSKYVSTFLDYGGVHDNSCIPSKAASLITAGGRFNGRTIQGLGQAKAERLLYSVMSWLGGSADFMDARDDAVYVAEVLSTDPILVKAYGFTPDDLCSVKNAYAAVGLGVGDADCDGVPDVQETDADGDTVPDNQDNCPFTSNTGQSDWDKDSMGDACDSDNDNDGLYDDGDHSGVIGDHRCKPGDPAFASCDDNCRFVSNPGQEDFNNDHVGDACEDSDGDGVMDDRDNCPGEPNLDQKNTDVDLYNMDNFGGVEDDALGDACDPDIDGDHKLNGVDNCVYVPNTDQKDSDTDTVGDACDLCPGVSDPDNGDPDGDGLGNPCDPDDDNDGILDDGDGSGVVGDHPCKSGVKVSCDDNCRETPNPDQLDGDGNGLGFACDGPEQLRAILDSIHHIPISLLPLPDPTSIVLSVCPTCGLTELAEGFTSIIHLRMDTPVTARVIDSNGIVVATATQAGTSLSLAFEPVPYGSTSEDEGGPPGAGGGGGVGFEAPGGLAPSRMRYRLQVIPATPASVGTIHTLDVQIEEVVPALFVRGDANRNGSIELPDAVLILNYLFRAAPGPSCLDAADANDDGDVDISDGVRVLLYLFAGVSLPPGTTPGLPQVDITPDALGCGG